MGVSFLSSKIELHEVQLFHVVSNQVIGMREREREIILVGQYKDEFALPVGFRILICFRHHKLCKNFFGGISFASPRPRRLQVEKVLKTPKCKNTL